MRDDLRRFAPVILLFFLSPIMGELISGASPLVEFFQPLLLLMLSALYGSGAILVREFTVRWKKGWPTIFVLGLAYGVLQEGLMVKSFFDPNWMDLDLLGTYGRWAGVNWVWSLDLMIYHSVVSIAIPIFLVEFIFPDRSGEPWLTLKETGVFLTLLLGVTILGYYRLTPYRPPGPQYFFAFLLMLGLILLARRMPSAWFSANSGPAQRPFWFGLAGFTAIVFFYVFLIFILPEMGVPVLLTVAITLLWAWVVLQMVKVLSGAGAWIERHQLALASGVLIFFAMLAPIQEWDETRTDETTGMIVVGVVLIVFLTRLWRSGIQKDRKVEIGSMESRG